MNALTALNWVWPPVLLALAVWTYVHARRSVTGTARWVLTPVIAVLALTSIGATYSNLALVRDADYGPFVLVGHSTGGTHALTYAARYPAQVAGMVLLDSSSPEQFTRMPDYPGQYQMMRRGLALMPTLRRVGVAELIPWGSHLPTADAERAIALTSTTQAASNQRDELSVIRDVFTQAQALTTFDNRPLAVLTASENVGTDGWVGAQEQLAHLSTNHVHRTVDSTHAGLLEDVGPATESVRAITEVVASVRTGTPLLDR